MTYSNISVNITEFGGTHAWPEITTVAQLPGQWLTLKSWSFIPWSAKSYNISLAFLLSMSIIFWFQLKLAHPTKTRLPLQAFKVMAVYSVRLFMCHSKWDWNTYSPFSSLHILYSPYQKKKKKNPLFSEFQFRLCKSSLLSFTDSQLTPFHFVFFLPFQWSWFTIILRHFICYYQQLWFLDWASS